MRKGQGKNEYYMAGMYIGYYEGEWDNDKRNGHGTFIDANQIKFEGGWLNDMKNGKGVKTYKDNSFIEGEWVNDKPVSYTRPIELEKFKRLELEIYKVDPVIYDTLIQHLSNYDWNNKVNY